MDYVIFTCRGTYSLYERFKTSHGARIPIEAERVWHKREQKHVVKLRAAIPGLIFVPRYRAPDFRRRVSENDYVKPVYLHMPLPKDRVIDPSKFVQATVAPDILARVQQKLNDEFGGVAQAVVETQEGEWYKVGDEVTIGEGSLLAGFTGAVQKIRKDGTIRLWLRNQASLTHIDIHKRFLTLVQ